MSQDPSSPSPVSAAPQPVLPYAGPTTNAQPVTQPMPYAWREGPVLITTSAAALPQQCVKCNAAFQGQTGWRRLALKLNWHQPAYYLLILAGLLVYVIVALCVQQKAVVEVSLCPVHAKKRTHWLLVAWTSAVVGLSLMIFGCAGGGTMARHNDMWPFWCIMGGILLAIVGGIAGILGARVLIPNRIERGYAWLKGAHPDFVAQFPDARQG